MKGVYLEELFSQSYVLSNFVVTLRSDLIKVKVVFSTVYARLMMQQQRKTVVRGMLENGHFTIAKYPQYYWHFKRG